MRFSATSSTIFCRCAMNIASGKTTTACALAALMEPKAFASSVGCRMLTTSSFTPSDRAAACVSATICDVAGKSGFARMATSAAAGTISFSMLNRLPLNSGLLVVTPVTFPPGRVKVATRPAASGSATAPKTIGTGGVALPAPASQGRPEAGRAGLGDGPEHDRHGGGRVAGRERPRRSVCEDDIDLEPNQFRSELRQPLVSAFCIARLDDEILPFDVSESA